MTGDIIYCNRQARGTEMQRSESRAGSNRNRTREKNSMELKGRERKGEK